MEKLIFKKFSNKRSLNKFYSCTFKAFTLYKRKLTDMYLTTPTTIKKRKLIELEESKEISENETNFKSK